MYYFNQKSLPYLSIDNEMTTSIVHFTRNREKTKTASIKPIGYSCMQYKPHKSIPNRGGEGIMSNQ